MKILAIDTSCDETACAVTEDTNILSNVIWSQASLHAKFGGVFPSLAKREHEKRIDWVIEKAITNAKCSMPDINAIAVTAGPGLAIALEVGIRKAKEISIKYKIPLVAVNHIEGHILSPLAKPNNEVSKNQLYISKHIENNKLCNHPSIINNISFPAIGIVTSGGHTQIIKIAKIGKYKILASTIDDALGEALDKAARMLGLGYPGGPVLEKLAKAGDPFKFVLPVPLIGQEKRMEFSYSGLKTAFFRLITEVKQKKGVLTKQDVCDLAAVVQRTAFVHFVRVTDWMAANRRFEGSKNILAGGGVMANITLRNMLRSFSKKNKLTVHFPYSKKLYGDNAAMIAIVAYFKMKRKEFVKDPNLLDRSPNAKIDQVFGF